MVQTLLLECDSPILKGFQHNHAFFLVACAISQALMKLAVTKNKIKEKKILCKVKVINYSINP